MQLCEYDPIITFVKACDHLLYQTLVEILIPDVLRPIPGTILKLVMHGSTFIEHQMLELLFNNVSCSVECWNRPCNMLNFYSIQQVATCWMALTNCFPVSSWWHMLVSPFPSHVILPTCSIFVLGQRLDVMSGFLPCVVQYLQFSLWFWWDPNE